MGANLAELVAEIPGKRQLDGPQNPNMQLQKRAPEEVQVGQPATFSLIVRNVGNATAHDVTVYDRVPKGTQLSRMNPPAEQESDGTLVWSLGEMAAGAEVTLAVELIPETEGEIGSTASVTFATQASVRTVSTQPKLEISQEAGSDVLVGEVMNIRVQVTNSGSGVAKDVALETDVPSGFKSTLGPSLGLALGDLAPGESKNGSSGSCCRRAWERAKSHSSSRNECCCGRFGVRDENRSTSAEVEHRRSETAILGASSDLSIDDGQ